MKYNYGAFRLYFQNGCYFIKNKTQETFWRYPGQGMRALLNILHLRHLFEFILSLATGRYLDLIACRYPLLISKIWKELRGLFRIQWLLKLFFSFHKLSFKLYYGTMEIIQPRMKHSHSSVFSDRCFALLLYHSTFFQYVLRIWDDQREWLLIISSSTPCFEDRYRRNDLGFEGEISRINSRSRNSSTRTDEKDQNQRI